DQMFTALPSGLVIWHAPILPSARAETLKQIFRRLRKYELSAIEAESVVRDFNYRFFRLSKPEATRAIRGTERIRRRRLMVSALGFILWDLRRDFHKNKRTRSAFAPFDKQWNCASDQLREVDKAVEAAYTDAPIFKDLSTEQWISNRSGV